MLDPGPGLAERLVELPDGRRIRAVLGGVDLDVAAPTVVFEAGVGGSAGSWVAVQRLVSARARTVAYDRAGYAGSDVDPADRTLQRLAAELADVLDALDERGPVVLVAHSWGGPVVRLLAASQPSRVAAVVLIEATRSEVSNPALSLLAALAYGVVGVATRLGLTRSARRRAEQRRSPDVSVEEQAVMLRDISDSSAFRAASREAAHVAAAIPRIRELEAEGLPDVPVAIVMGAKKAGTLGARFLEASRAEAESHPRARFVLVEGAGHAVPQEAPVAAADAVLGALDVLGALGA